MLNNRWDICAPCPVSRERFIGLAEKFRQAAEEVFGTKCQLEIRALDRPAFIRYGDGTDEWVDYVLQNDEQATFHRTDNLGALDAGIWGRAASIKIMVSPLSDMPDARGHVIFDRQDSPHKVSFNVYRHAGGLDIERAMHRLPLRKGILRLALKCVR